MNGKIVTLLLALVCCVAALEGKDTIGPQCLLPLVRGPCKAVIVRYGYNPETNQCEEFTYGGCRGNENNFKSLDKCVQACL